MFSLLSFYLELILIIYTDCFDPDEDICNDFTLNSAVYADDGNTYIFKGTYFWETNQLNNKPGIISTARKLSEKWPQLTEPITASFTIPDRNRKLMTIFLIKDRWYGYQNGRLILSGSTTNWYLFPHDRVSTAFPMNHENPMVFFLYDMSTKYILFDMTNKNRPFYVRKGGTIVGRNYVWFLETTPHETTNILTDLIDVNAVITYENLMVFLAKTRYCFVDLNQSVNQKLCVPKNYSNSNLFNCPLVKQNISPTHHLHSNNTQITMKTTITMDEPVNQALITNKPKNQSITPLVIAAILIAVIVSFIVIGGIIGYIIKRRRESSHRREITETTQKSTETDYSIMTIDSRYGNVVTQPYNNEPKLDK